MKLKPIRYVRRGEGDWESYWAVFPESFPFTATFGDRKQAALRLRPDLKPWYWRVQYRRANFQGEANTRDGAQRAIRRCLEQFVRDAMLLAEPEPAAPKPSSGVQALQDFHESHRTAVLERLRERSHE